MSILSLVKDPNKERVEGQIIRLLELVRFNFPVNIEISPDDILLALSELIAMHEITQIYDCISAITSFHSNEGEHAIVTLHCALQNKINVSKSQVASLAEEIEIARAKLANAVDEEKKKKYSKQLEQFEMPYKTAQRIMNSPHYFLFFTTIQYETTILQQMKAIKAEPDCDNFKNRRLCMMNDLLTLLVSFRNNQISLEQLHQGVQKHSRKTRVIPHTSVIGATFAFFVGKSTTTAKLSYDFLEMIKKSMVKTNLRITNN